MSVGIVVTEVPDGLTHREFSILLRGAGYEKDVYFDNNGYYWFLYELFEELSSQTGQMIDLYETVVFSGDQLIYLRSTFEKADHLISSQPTEWMVRIGWEYEVGGKEILALVTKHTFKMMLDKLLALANQAIDERKSIIFAGD